MQILVVEDERRMAELLRRGLSEEGHRVVVARDGAEGFEMARSSAFDVIVLDVMLPRMVPPGIAFEMLYLGEYIGMEEAKRWGMVNRVVPRGEALNEALRMAEAICENAPVTIRRMKETAVRHRVKQPSPSRAHARAPPSPCKQGEGPSAFLPRPL